MATTPAAIRVENLGKSYRIAHRTGHGGSLRDALAGALAAPWNRLRGRGTGGSGMTSETFWALRDTSFEVRSGEVVGVVGRNGAGKSTLLKILSRITEPTEGEARIRGRVASLLEVGTGFHPELTGRENIYLNGSLLGMRRTEIDRKFDEIVAFSEIEKFLDTPVKHYSTGMYVRLAFAVAAHLDTQVLIVDEVLAVGDASFQKKCLGRLEEVTRDGRAVLFVSHNMPAVQNLCTRCLYLEGGRVKLDGPPAEVLEAYVSASSVDASREMALENHPGRTQDSRKVLRSVKVRGLGNKVEYIEMGDGIEVEIGFRTDTPLNGLTCWVFLKNSLGMNVFGFESDVNGERPVEWPVSSGVIRCRTDELPLVAGTYIIDLYLGAQNFFNDVVHDACRFEIQPADVFGTGRIPNPHSGSIFWPAKWTYSPETEPASPAVGNHA